MPIYEYRCAACGHELEALQRFADAPLVACPTCGKDSLTKLLSAAGFQLKGSGWYATDFKNSGSKPPAKPATESDAKASTADTSESKAASTDAKSDAKPATETKSVTADKPSGTTGSSTASS
jgi:putative FmdB family regulatory protein